MSRRHLALLLVLAPLAWLEAKQKPAPTPVPAEKLEGFKAFHYVKVRNIFDPNRRRDPAEPGSPDSLSAAARDRGSEGRGAPFLALTGVMTRPEKQVGFFTGSSSEYQKVVGAGQTVGDYKIKGVTMAGVEMERDGKSFILPVGSQIRFDAAGAGTIQSFAAESAPSVPTLPSGGPPDSSSPSSPSTSSSAPSSGSSPSDVLKRMMERRQQEISK